MDCAAAKEFILGLACEHPITSDAFERNYCRFCEVSWCSSEFEDALTPKAGHNYGIGFAPHHPNCAWVVANQLAGT